VRVVTFEGPPSSERGQKVTPLSQKDLNRLSSLETPKTLRDVRYISARRSAIAPGDLVGT
jgi:hypothetical protein